MFRPVESWWREAPHSPTKNTKMTFIICEVWLNFRINLSKLYTHIYDFRADCPKSHMHTETNTQCQFKSDWYTNSRKTVCHAVQTVIWSKNKSASQETRQTHHLRWNRQLDDGTWKSQTHTFTHRFKLHLMQATLSFPTFSMTQPNQTPLVRQIWTKLINHLHKQSWVRTLKSAGWSTSDVQV